MRAGQAKPVDRPESEEDAEGKGGREEEHPAKMVMVKKDIKKKSKGLLTHEQIMAATAMMSNSGLNDLSSIRMSTYNFPIRQLCVAKIFVLLIYSVYSVRLLGWELARHPGMYFRSRVPEILLNM